MKKLIIIIITLIFIFEGTGYCLRKPIDLAINDRAELAIIIELAKDKDSYNLNGIANPSNKQLYKEVARFLGINRGVALDVWADTNILPAQGLIEAGMEKL